MAFGSNLPEQHPIIYWRLKEALEKRKFPVIVVDPRVTMFAQLADIHLPITPGTDLVLLNSLAHVILKEGLQDRDYIDSAYHAAFEEFAQLVAHYDPTTAASICGIDEDTIRHVARTLRQSRRGHVDLDHGHQSKHARLRRRRGDQQPEPASPAISASPAAPASPSPASAMPWARGNGRPARACRATARWRSENDREKIAKFWGIDPEFFPQAARAVHDRHLSRPSRPARSRRLWLVATNPMTSMPNIPRIKKTLEKLEFLVVQDAYADVETTQYAHVFLPAACGARRKACSPTPSGA